MWFIIPAALVAMLIAVVVLLITDFIARRMSMKRCILVVLTTLALLPDCANAGAILPWRRQVEQRLRAQEELIRELIAQRLAPQPQYQQPPQPQIIIVPSPQGLPHQGEPKQQLPIQGAPKQELPDQGEPKQDLPKQDEPRQPLNPQGPPQQQFPEQRQPREMMSPSDPSRPQSLTTIRYRALARPLE